MGTRGYYFRFRQAIKVDILDFNGRLQRHILLRLDLNTLRWLVIIWVIHRHIGSRFDGIFILFTGVM